MCGDPTTGLFKKDTGFLEQMTTQRTVIVLGNGQLGLMLSKAAKNLGTPLAALSLPDAQTWLNTNPDPMTHLVTFEQEHVGEDLLADIQAKGLSSFPTWSNFLLLKSKLRQKYFLSSLGIPTSPFLSASPWTPECDAFIRERKGAILKSGKGGYDGKGVWTVDASGSTKDGSAKDVAAKLVEPYLEEKISFDYEAAAVVCRSESGDLELYPTVRSIQENGICTRVEYEEKFAATKEAKNAGELARKIAENLRYVGILAVECFVSKDQVLVNEIAPRVHNSGHFTIDVCAGSQFENHLRAGLGMPLAKSAPTHKSALMVNLLWPEQEKEFAPLFARLTCGPEWEPNAKLHWYGKSEIRANRKMGHFTVYGDRIEDLRKQADQILASRWA
jgi:5-(carboxyamino)imidazole ribonucleotide synthase